MKSNTVPQAISISQYRVGLLRQAILLMFMSLLTITLFAESKPPVPAKRCPSFSATIHQQKVVLKWAVSNEKLISHYIIERSTNGNEYTDIANVFTGETSSPVQQYSFQENIPAASGAVYYRLKTVSSDGSLAYSAASIINVAQQTEDFLVSLYPVSDAGQQIILPDWQNRSINLTSVNRKGESVKMLMINNTVPGQSAVAAGKSK